MLVRYSLNVAAELCIARRFRSSDGCESMFEAECAKFSFRLYTLDVYSARDIDDTTIVYPVSREGSVSFVNYRFGRRERLVRRRLYVRLSDIGSVASADLRTSALCVRVRTAAV